jgi:alpha-glucuronidase
MRKWVVLILILGMVLTPGCKPAKEGELVYTAPYEMGVDAGEYLPGTGIRYVDLTDQGAHMTIDGQEAYKQKGDSVNWSGKPVDNAKLDFSGRVVWYTDTACQILGTATLTLEDVVPQVVPNIPEAPLRYRAVVTYRVDKGQTMPGTLIAYKGKTDDGAELDGVEGYPYRKAGDSIVWQGKLRDGVYVVVNVRTVFYTDSTLQVAGTAEVILVPPGASGSGFGG